MKQMSRHSVSNRKRHPHFWIAGEPTLTLVCGLTISMGFLILGVLTRGDEGAFESAWSACCSVGENTDAVYGLNFLNVGLELKGRFSGISGQNSRSSSRSNDLDK